MVVNGCGDQCRGVGPLQMVSCLHHICLCLSAELVLLGCSEDDLAELRGTSLEQAVRYAQLQEPASNLDNFLSWWQPTITQHILAEALQPHPIVLFAQDALFQHLQ